MVALTAACFVPSDACANSMVELVENDRLEVQITVVEGRLRITNANAQTVYVYNIAGQCIHTQKIDGTDRQFDFNLTKGCYIIKVGNVTRKITISK